MTRATFFPIQIEFALVGERDNVGEEQVKNRKVKSLSRG